MTAPVGDAEAAQLFGLLFAAPASDAAPLDARRAKTLVAAGLLARESADGRPGPYQPTEEGWAWAAQNLGRAFDFRGLETGSALASLLWLVARHLEHTDTPLAEFVGHGAPPPVTANRPKPPRKPNATAAKAKKAAAKRMPAKARAKPPARRTKASGAAKPPFATRAKAPRKAASETEPPRTAAKRIRASNSARSGTKTGPGAAKTGPGAAKTGPGAAKRGPGAAKTGPGAAKTGPSAAKTSTSAAKIRTSARKTAAGERKTAASAAKSAASAAKSAASAGQTRLGAAKTTASAAKTGPSAAKTAPGARKPAPGAAQAAAATRKTAPAEVAPSGDSLRVAERLPLPERLLGAYRQLTGGQANVRVRIHTLRGLVPDAAASEFDRALRALIDRGTAAVYPLDDPRQRTAEDEQGALNESGIRQHVVLMG